MLMNAPYPTVHAFAKWQEGRLVEDVRDGVVYEATKARLCALNGQEEVFVAEGALQMSNDVLRCGEWEMPMSQITDLAMHGQRAIVFTAEKQYYELIPEQGSNALKFMLYYTEYKQYKNTKSLVG